MLQVISNAELMDRDRKESAIQEAVRDTQAQVENPIITGLAAYIRVCWEQAKRAKVDIETQILKNMRQKQGIYETSKLAAIRAMKSSEVFMKITGVKCRHAKDWVKDILFQPGTTPWEVEPTPKPDVPPWVREHIEQKVIQMRMAEVLMESAQTGQPIPVEMIPNILQNEMPAIMEQMEKEISNEAKKIAEKMKRQIDDQLTEGKFYKALSDVIPDIVLHTGFLKGPTYRKMKARKLVPNPQTGRLESKVVEEIRGLYERISPLDCYPAPDSNGINDGFFIEKSSMNGVQLSSLKGVPTFDSRSIDSALEQYGKGGLKEWTAIDSERATLEHKDSSVIHDSTKMDCLVFWGQVQGHVLMQWGMSLKEVPDPLSYYHVCAWNIGNYVIKAMLNEDPEGKKPYYKASFDETDGGFWGQGLPQLIDSIQEGANATARHTLNNIGVAAGAMVEINEDRVPGGGDPAPNRVWRSHSDAMGSSTPAVQVWNVPLVADKLMIIFDSYRKMADEDSGVPAYAHGDPDVKGAGNTASGLSMLMTSSARGIKGVIKTIDENIILPVVEERYYWNAGQVENAALVGDFKCKATGSSSLIAKEQQAVRRAEFLKTTQNQFDFALMGADGRKYLLKDTARALELDAEKAVPDTPAVNPQDGPEVEQQTPGKEPAPGNKPKAPQPKNKPRTLNRAGDSHGGRDFRLNNQRGAIANV